MAAPENNVRRQRNERGCRSWNQEEEEGLLACLKELVVTGWKSDNSFRAGYVNKLEEMMRVQFPRAEIKATPHITSKITGWKKNYGSLAYILSRSGVGFNLHGDFTVDSENEQWEQICNVDANAKNIRFKSWPYMDGWIEVFGKDRATGETAEDVMDVVNELIIEDNLHVAENVVEEHNIGLEQDVPETPEAEYSSLSSRRDTSVCKCSRKRKAVDDVDRQLCDLLGEMHKETNNRLEKLSSRIGYQHDLGQARKEISEMLEMLPGFSENEQFDVADILIDCHQRLEYFTSLAPSKRSAYAKRLIRRKGL